MKISDFGLSTILDGTESEQSIVGTPLYQSPQVLKRRCYNDTVDTWALGVILYELLVGQTPFHCFDMRELVRKINDGRYKVTVEGGEHIKIETCLFLLDCLQTLEENRIMASGLIEHPFISDDMVNIDLHDMDIDEFKTQTGGKDQFSDFTSENGSAMLSRFDDSEIYEQDVILTTRRSY